VSRCLHPAATREQPPGLPSISCSTSAIKSHPRFPTTVPQQASAAVAAMGKLKSGPGTSRFSSATSSTRRGPVVRPCLEEATVEATATTAPSYVCITEDADDDGGETVVSGDYICLQGQDITVYCSICSYLLSHGRGSINVNEVSCAFFFTIMIHFASLSFVP
jgi:hypothetical protein